MARTLDDPDRLRHMLEAAEKALGLARKSKRADFEKNEVLQLALARLVEIIGEAASRVSPLTRKRHPELPWPNIVGMRNRIVHDYYQVNLEILWQTVKHDLPSLIKILKEVVTQEPRPRQFRKKS